MRLPILFITLALSLSSCKKDKKDTKVNPPISQKLTGTYKGDVVWNIYNSNGDLSPISWEKQNGELTLSFEEGDVKMRSTLFAELNQKYQSFTYYVKDVSYLDNDIYVMAKESDSSCEQVIFHYYGNTNSIEYVTSGNCVPESYLRFMGRKP